MKTLVVDFHALAGKGDTWADPSRPVEYEVNALFERGAEAGIDRYCVAAPRGADYPAANRETARLCERHSGKLIGIAVHDPKREAGRIRETLAAEVKSMGMRAVRADGHPGRELMDAAAELRIPVIYYPAMASGQGPARRYHIVAMTYPSVPLVLPHLGNYRSGSWIAHMEALDLARRYRNVYLDTAGLGSLKYLEMAVRELPPEKLLFGTAAPELDPRVEIHAVKLMRLPAPAEAKVLGGNAARLLGL